jgi:hypothetical protein
MNADQGLPRTPGNLLRVAAGTAAAALIVTAVSAVRRRPAWPDRDSGPARGRQLPPQAVPGTSLTTAPSEAVAPTAPEAVGASRPAVSQVAVSVALLLCTATALSAVTGRRRVGGKRGAAAHARASGNQADNGNGALPSEIPADMGDPWIMGAPWSTGQAPVRPHAGPSRAGAGLPQRTSQRTQHVDDYPSWPGRPGPGALHPDHPSWGGGRNDPRWDSTEQVLRQDNYPSWPESSAPPWRDAEPPAAHDDSGWGGGGSAVSYRGPAGRPAAGQSAAGPSATGPRTVRPAATDLAPQGGFTPRISLAASPGLDLRQPQAPPAAYASQPGPAPQPGQTPQPGQAPRPGYGPRPGTAPYQGLDSRPVATAPAGFVPSPGPAHQAGYASGSGPSPRAGYPPQGFVTQPDYATQSSAPQPGYPAGPGSAPAGPVPRADFVPRHSRAVQPGATGVMERVRPPADRVPEVSRGQSAPGQVWDAGSVELATWIINEANQQATEIRHEARGDAAAARAEAKLEAGKLVKQAADQAAATLAAAEQQAARVRAEILKLSADLGGVASSFTESLLSPPPPAAARPQADAPPKLRAQAAAGAAAPSATGSAVPATADPAAEAAARLLGAPAATPATTPAVKPTAKPAAKSAARTASAVALKPGVSPRRTKPEPRDAGKAKNRQVSASRKVTAAFVALSVAGVATGVTEVVLHGPAFFVFRANGAGASQTGLTEDQGPGQPNAPGAHHNAKVVPVKSNANQLPAKGKHVKPAPKKTGNPN